MGAGLAAPGTVRTLQPGRPIEQRCPGEHAGEGGLRGLMTLAYAWCTLEATVELS